MPAKMETPSLPLSGVARRGLLLLCAAAPALLPACGSVPDLAGDADAAGLRNGGGQPVKVRPATPSAELTADTVVLKADGTLVYLNGTHPETYRGEGR